MPGVPRLSRPCSPAWADPVAEGLGGGDTVEGDDAGRGDVVDVAGRLAFMLGVHVDGQLGRVDELVAPHTILAGGEEPGDGVDLPDVPVAGDRDLHADLGGGDEVLVDGGVDPVPGGVAVGGQEDSVAGRQRVPGGDGLDPLGDDGQADAWPGTAGVAGRDLGLERADVGGRGAEQAGQVGGVHDVVVDQDELAHAEPGEELGDDRPGAAETGDGDAKPAEGFLASVAEQAGLPVIGRVGRGWPGGPGTQADEVSTRRPG